MKDLQFLNQHWKDQLIDKIDIMLKDFDTNKISIRKYISEIIKSNKGFNSFETPNPSIVTFLIYHLIITFNKYDKKNELTQYLRNNIVILKFLNIHNIKMYWLKDYVQLSTEEKKIIFDFLVHLSIVNNNIIKFNFNFIIGLEYVEAKYLKQYSKLFFAIDKKILK